MATVQAIQDQLGNGGSDARIMRSEYGVDGANADMHYVVGNGDAQGRSRWCETDSTDSAADQATAILAVLVDGY